MTDGLEALTAMEYPGRFIIIGTTPAEDTAVFYGMTGRRPSSRGRKFVPVPLPTEEITAIETEYLDPNVEQSLRELQLYPAMSYDTSRPSDFVAVSNGHQTGSVVAAARFDGRRSACDILISAHERWDFEPDPPFFTSRISGVVIPTGAAMGIIKRCQDGTSDKWYFELPREIGKGKLLATYDGKNDNVPLAFGGEPRDVETPWLNVGDGVRHVYDALAPKEGMDDLRAGVIGVYRTQSGLTRAAILNRGTDIQYI
ncbi:MAG TPA: IMP cyclohydrolase [Candidatus Nanoarchaeia archaeon]|nr:IMP cyclohydrolase [Candidatus Nanoarchaeia archaeon]